MIGWLKKAFPFATFGGGGGPRRGVNVNAWSLRDWQRVLRGDLVGDLSVEQLMRSSAVVACAGLIADTLASAPLYVVQRVPGGGLREVDQSDASSVLRTLTYDDRAAAVFGAATLGNGWLWQAPDGTLCALDSNRTLAYVDPQGRIWIKQGADPYVSYASVAHLRFRSQPGYVLGFNPCLLACDSLKADLGLVRMAGAMATRSSAPSGLLRYPGVLTDEAADRIRIGWQEQTVGEASGGTPILEEGLDWKPVEAPNATDAQMVEALEWSAADVCRLYNVPPTLVGLLKNTNRSTATEENRAFHSRCLRPWSARIGSSLSRLLLSDTERAAGLCIETDLSTLALGEGVERATYLRQLVLSGILSRNEARNSIGYEDAPDGDVPMAPLNMTPADQLGANNAG